MLNKSCAWLLALPLLLSAQVSVRAASPFEEQLQKAKAALEAGESAKAETLLRQLIQADPTNAIAYGQLGLVLADQGKTDEAQAVLQRAAQLNSLRAVQCSPNNPKSYPTLQQLLFPQDSVASPEEEVLAQAQDRLAKTPQDAQAHLAVAVALVRLERWDGAIAQLQEAIKLDPKNPVLYQALGSIFSLQDRWPEAATAFRKVLELSPNEAAIHAALGLALFSQGQFAEAISEYQNVFSLTQSSTLDYAVIHNAIGLALQAQGKLPEAIASFEEAIRLNANYFPSHINQQEAERQLALQQKAPASFDEEHAALPSLEQRPHAGSLRSTARILTETDEGTGLRTGWVIQQQDQVAWILTTRRALSDAKTKRLTPKVAVEFFSQLPVTRRPRYNVAIAFVTAPEHPSLDLAVLKVEGVPTDIQALPLSPSESVQGSPVQVIDHPLTGKDPWNAIAGQMHSLVPECPTLIISLPTVEAVNMGDPILNAQGQVIGMLNGNTVNPRALAASVGETSPSGSLAIAYRLEPLLKQLREWGILNP
jgi:superkiller protein 3